MLVVDGFLEELSRVVEVGGNRFEVIDVMKVDVIVFEVFE